MFLNAILVLDGTYQLTVIIYLSLYKMRRVSCWGSCPTRSHIRKHRVKDMPPAPSSLLQLTSAMFPGPEHKCSIHLEGTETFHSHPLEVSTLWTSNEFHAASLIKKRSMKKRWCLPGKASSVLDTAGKVSPRGNPQNHSQTSTSNSPETQCWRRVSKDRGVGPLRSFRIFQVPGRASKASQLAYGITSF